MSGSRRRDQAVPGQDARTGGGGFGGGRFTSELSSLQKLGAGFAGERYPYRVFIQREVRRQLAFEPALPEQVRPIPPTAGFLDRSAL